MENGQLKIRKTENALKDKSYSFALEVVKMCRSLREQHEFVSKQLLRSGTAIGALIEEASQAEPKVDFIHKLSISNKEANETKYWIRLWIDSEVIESKKGEALLNQCTELVKILTASIKTSKSKR